MTEPDNQKSGMFGRIRNLILHPRDEWTRIDTEEMSPNAVFTGWAVPLAAIAPVCQFLGGQIFGYGVPGLITYRVPLASALTTAVIGYGLALAATYLFALVIDGLAGSFGAVRDRGQAMKVAVFSSIPSWLAGVFGLVPALAILGIVGLYSLYLLFVGLPMLMRAPQDRAVGYVVVSVLCGIGIFFVVGIVAGALSAALFPFHPGGVMFG